MSCPQGLARGADVLTWCQEPDLHLTHRSGIFRWTLDEDTDAASLWTDTGEGALYNRYRPQSFSLAGIEIVVKT